MVEKLFTPLWKIRREYTEIYLLEISSVFWPAFFSSLPNLDIVAKSRIPCREIPACSLAWSVGASLQHLWKWHNRSEEGLQKERTPTVDRSYASTWYLEAAMRQQWRPVSCYFGLTWCQIAYLHIASPSVLMPTLGRYLLWWTKMPASGPLYAGLCLRTITSPFQQVWSVYGVHWIIGGSFACAWASPVEKSSWRNGGRRSLPQNLVSLVLAAYFLCCLVPSPSK